MVQLYLVIMDDGEVFTTSSLTDDDLKMCEEGWIDLIDITNPSKPLSYRGGGRWVQIKELER